MCWKLSSPSWCLPRCCWETFHIWSFHPPCTHVLLHSRVCKSHLTFACRLLSPSPMIWFWTKWPPCVPISNVSRQNGSHFVQIEQYWKNKHHWKTKHKATIGIPNAFGIPPLYASRWNKQEWNNIHDSLDLRILSCAVDSNIRIFLKYFWGVSEIFLCVKMCKAKDD